VPIRPAVEAALDEICALIRELAEYERAASEVVFDVEDVRRNLFGPTPAASVLVAETDEGDVAGFALYFTTFSTWLGKSGIWLEDLFVRPQYRQRGYGLALLAELGRRTEARVEWAVLDWNEPSIRFYEAMGARPVDGWTRYRWLPASS
jgi:GNAT superfamily N-acetyltransferase